MRPANVIHDLKADDLSAVEQCGMSSDKSAGGDSDIIACDVSAVERCGVSAVDHFCCSATFTWIQGYEGQEIQFRSKSLLMTLSFVCAGISSELE